jgi:hypothetical protein
MNFYRNGSEEAELEKFERSQPDRIFGRPSGDYAPVSDIPIGGPTEVVAQNMQSASRKSAQVAQWAEDACIGLKQKYLQCKADSNVLTRTLCLAMQVEYLNCVEKKKVCTFSLPRQEARKAHQRHV